MANRSNCYTPLRYPGGKGAFSPFIKALIEKNDLMDCDYVEPFAGGAGIAIDLLFSGYCKNIHINDLDLAIFHFWQSAIFDTDHFIALIEQTPITIEQWHRQKAILFDPDNHSAIEHGFAAFFLNRSNRSGILKAGVIGGKHQSGVYKIDARFNKSNLIKRIERISEHREHIFVHNQDAVELLAQTNDLLPAKSLIYLDPPYYVKGKELYRNFYQHDDHIMIKERLDKINHYWLVSYDDCQQIRDIYVEYDQQSYQLNYSVQTKRKGTEVIIYDHKLKPVPLQH